MLDGEQYLSDMSRANVGDMSAANVGAFGYDVIDDTDDHTPSTGYGWFALHCITETVFATMTPSSKAPVTGTLVGATLSAGFWVFGEFTALTLTSGDVIAYRKPLR
jgi:hypothetical protein